MSNKFYLKSKNGTVALAIKVQDSPRKQSPIYGEVDVIMECSRINMATQDCWRIFKHWSNL